MFIQQAIDEFLEALRDNSHVKSSNDTLHEYLDALRQEGKSSRTIAIYQWHLEKMLQWLDERGCSLDTIERAVIRAWGAGLWDRWQAATVRTAVCAARSFFAWLKENGKINHDLGTALKVPTIPKKVQRTLTDEEVLTLMKACDTSTPKGCRDLAIICMLTDPGLRAAELCSLRLADLNLEQKEIIIIAKGGNQEIGYFGEYAANCLEAWLVVRQQLAVQGVQAVFVSIGGITPGMPLTARGLRTALKRLGESVGIKGVCPHAFRRSMTTLATELGAPSRVVQEMGRWKNSGEIERYSRALQVKKIVRMYLPIDHLVSGEPGTQT